MCVCVCGPQLSSEQTLSRADMFTSRRAVLTIAAAAVAVDQAAAFSPAAGSLRLRAPRSQAICTAASRNTVEVNAAASLKMSGMGEKYGHLRGADVEPCGAAVERFYKLFGKPVMRLPWSILALRSMFL